MFAFQGPLNYYKRTVIRILFSPYSGWSRAEMQTENKHYILGVNEENIPLIQTCGKNQVHDLVQHFTSSRPPDK